jgi:hypothetical protein
MDEHSTSIRIDKKARANILRTAVFLFVEDASVQTLSGDAHYGFEANSSSRRPIRSESLSRALP